MRESFDVHRIHEAAFGAPIEARGRTVVPVSRVVGFGGSARVAFLGGTSGGFVGSRPLGVYDVADGSWLPTRRWWPAALVGVLLGAAAALVLRPRYSQPDLLNSTQSPPATDAISSSENG